MSVLPVTTRVRPVHRVLAKIWNATTNTWGDWQAQPMAQRINAKRWTNGFILTPWSRKALPDYGSTSLIWYSGAINGRDESDGPNLRGAQIRIQATPGPEAGAEASWAEPTAWTDVWWGAVQFSEFDRRANRKTYFCIDLLADFAQRCQIICHNAKNAPAAPGHPGYNLPFYGGFARAIGNKDGTLDPYDRYGEFSDPALNRNYFHTYPGSPTAAVWTDAQVLGSLLQVARRPGDPLILVQDYVGVLSNTSLQHAWPITPGQPLWGPLNQICDRRRGRGVAFFDWIPNADPRKEPTPILKILPQHLEKLYFGFFNGDDLGAAEGASSAGTTIALDYVNDQRLCQGPVLAERSQYRYDYVETRGEPIQVLATLSYADGSLAPRWATADATAFNALGSSFQRSTSRWDPVYQRHGLPITWDWMAGDGLGANKSGINFRCMDSTSGVFIPPHDSITAEGASLLTARILPDLCLYEGYNYGTGILGGVRYDTSTDLLSPPRLPPLVMRKASATTFFDLARLGFSLSIDEQWGIYLRYGPNGADTDGGRYFGKTTAPATPNVVDDYANILGTFTLELNHRVRAASGSASGRRRLTIDVPGAHLWLAHPQAIWRLNRESVSTSEAPALRNAGANPTSDDTTYVRRLRDDRPWIRIVHQLACQWYLVDHTPVTFSQRGSTAIEVKDAAGTVIVQPQLGKFITTLTSTTRTGTVVDTVNCPITSLTYDPGRDQTDIVADWTDLDFTA